MTCRRRLRLVDPPGHELHDPVLHAAVDAVREELPDLDLETTCRIAARTWLGVLARIEARS